jgi:hypothetical protein
MASDTILPAAQAAQTQIAVAGGGFWTGLGSIAAGVIGGACYAVVWLTGQAFTIMIFLNPFSFLDPFLKAAKTTFLLTIVALCSWLPVVGIVIAGLYILFAWLVAGYCLRLMGWGTVLSWDVLFKRGKGRVDDPKGVLAFADTGMEGPPIRTLGRLTSADKGQLLFTYRPWFLLPSRAHRFDVGEAYIIEGIIFPTIDRQQDGGGEELFSLPPRYKGKETEIVEPLWLSGQGQTRLLGGIRGFWAWAKSLFTGKKEPAPEGA